MRLCDLRADVWKHLMRKDANSMNQSIGRPANKRMRKKEQLINLFAYKSINMSWDTFH